MNRKVTEEDFRMPEYRNANVEDYEFRPDGKLVRKDRWETGIQSIRSIMGISARDFEISEVVAAVRDMAASLEGWVEVTNIVVDRPDENSIIEVKIEDGSILRGVLYDHDLKQWLWNGKSLPLRIVAWREERYQTTGEEE